MFFSVLKQVILQKP